MKWLLRFRSTTCVVRCGDQQLRCTHCTYGLFQFVSLVHHSNSCWRWRYLLLEAVVELRRKGYAIESDVEENDLDKGDEQLFHYLELRHTERSCLYISKSVLNHVALTLKDTWMRLEPTPSGRINVNWHHMIWPKHPSSCNSAGGRIAKLLLVGTRDVRWGSACFQTAVARKRQVSGHGFQFKILSSQSPLQVLEVCKGNFRALCILL